MKLIIFGATGSIGLQLVEQALNSNYNVTAFTRNPQKLSVAHPNLKIFEGDILDVKAVENAVREQTCVLCAIGDGNKGKIRSAGTKNIIMAMTNTSVNRLICQTTLGLGDSYGNLNFFWKKIMFGFLLKNAFADHEIQEKHVVDSNLDWTIIRPSAFINGTITDDYKIDFDSNYKPLKLKISRADVADFMLKQIKSDVFLKKSVSISN